MTLTNLATVHVQEDVDDVFYVIHISMLPSIPHP